MMNKKILPENIFVEKIKKENESNSLEKNLIFSNHKNEIRFFTAITLPLILAEFSSSGLASL